MHQKKPLVLAFHGRNGTGYDIEGFSEIDALDAIAVYPIGLIGADNKTAWQGAPYAAGTSDVQFVADLLDHLQATLCVDPKGIYAVGKSNGGGFAALLACQMPLRIAAFGVVAGALYDGTKDGCAESGPAPVIDFHGSSDPIADYDGEPNNNGGALPSIWQWSKDRATHDGCAPTPVTTQINSGVIKYAWGSCQGTTEVTHYKVIGGGHTWPDAPVDSGPGPETDDIGATQVIWAFFLAHPLNVQINS
ncbi:polyhydroxybutyrate depolymerase [Actinokineospora baliensis]|nr:polyhydroxybutyrate depolymerase [Actinokineospora baliensis]